MDKTAIAGSIRQLLEGLFREKGLELVEVICRYESGKLVIRILTDWPQGGISLEECAGLNKEVGAALDENNALGDEDYLLEVSSPGLDRPLKTKNDFLRCRNKRARFFLNDMINGKVEWDGIIDNADEDSVYVKTSDAAITIPLSKINMAKQLF